MNTSVPKPSLLILYCILFAAGVFAFTIYWAYNFSKYTTYKGDEFLMLLEWLLVFAYIFCLIVQVTDWKEKSEVG